MLKTIFTFKDRNLLFFFGCAVTRFQIGYLLFVVLRVYAVAQLFVLFHQVIGIPVVAQLKLCFRKLVHQCQTAFAGDAVGGILQQFFQLFFAFTPPARHFIDQRFLVFEGNKIPVKIVFLRNAHSGFDTCKRILIIAFCVQKFCFVFIENGRQIASVKALDHLFGFIESVLHVIGIIFIEINIKHIQVSPQQIFGFIFGSFRERYGFHVIFHGFIQLFVVIKNDSHVGEITHQQIIVSRFFGKRDAVRERDVEKRFVVIGLLFQCAVIVPKFCPVMVCLWSVVSFQVFFGFHIQLLAFGIVVSEINAGFVKIIDTFQKRIFGR